MNHAYLRNHQHSPQIGDLLELDTDYGTYAYTAMVASDLLETERLKYTGLSGTIWESGSTVPVDLGEVLMVIDVFRDDPGIVVCTLRDTIVICYLELLTMHIPQERMIANEVARYSVRHHG